MTVVVLAGGTGGAKLARGMRDVAGGDLVVVANTGDDVEIHGAHVSPDVDLASFWLEDRIDERGWGIAGDTFEVMDELRRLGEEVWFSLGDRDLALGLARARRLRAGQTPTQVARELTPGVLPMCHEPVRTWVDGLPFQEWMVRRGGKGGGERVGRVELRGVEGARPTPEVLDALARARAVVIGPSNPVISIGPILSVPGLREAIHASPGPVVAVSPLVRGRAVKGPTERFLEWMAVPASSDGIAAHYGDLLDGLVADERAQTLPTLETDVLMADAAGRARLAEETLRFAEGLGRRPP